MYPNTLKRAIRQNGPVLGMYSATLHPTFVEVMAKSGVDFVILDTEHNAYGLERCVDCIRAAEAWSITPLVRVYENNPALINKALEVGAMGVVVPHVDTVDLARQAVAATKYPPDGIRGVNPSTRASGYVTGPEEWDQAWRTANKETMVVLQPLESMAGIANLDQIVAIPGVDLIRLGIGDLSQVLGAPMCQDDVRVREAQERALTLCQQQGVATYALVSGFDDVRKWYDRGVRVFVAGSDIGAFQRTCKSFVEGFREAIA